MVDRTPHFYAFCVTHTIYIFANVLLIFSFGVLIYLETDSVTQYAVFISLAYCAELVVAPVAGSVFDRVEKEKIFIGCSAAFTLICTVFFYLSLTNNLSLYVFYFITIFSSCISGLHRVSYNATIPLFTSETNKLSRYNGAVYLGIACSHLIAPVVAGNLIDEIDITHGLRLAIFCGALVTLLSWYIAIPGKVNHAVDQSRNTLRKIVADLMEGYSYIMQNVSIRYFLYLHCAVNFMRGIVIVLFTPLVLSFSDANTLGLLRSSAGMGMLIGGVIMSVWVGPKRLVDSTLYSLFGTGFFMLLTGVQESSVIIAISVFFFYVLTAILSTVGYTLWQKNVNTEIVGRVFAFRDMVTGASLLSAYLVSPLVTEYVLEPFMNSRNEIALLISAQIGHGEGRGIALMFILIGVVTILLTPYVSNNRSIRLLKI